MFPQQMFPVRANGETTRETTVFPQQCFLVLRGPLMIIIFRFNDNRYFGLEIMLQPDVLAAMSSPDAAIINTEKTLGTRMLSDTRWRCTEWREVCEVRGEVCVGTNHYEPGTIELYESFIRVRKSTGSSNSGMSINQWFFIYMIISSVLKGSLSTSVHCGRLILLLSGRLDIFQCTNDTIRAGLPSRVRSTCSLSVIV